MLCTKQKMKKKYIYIQKYKNKERKRDDKPEFYVNGRILINKKYPLL